VKKFERVNGIKVLFIHQLMH